MRLSLVGLSLIAAIPVSAQSPVDSGLAAAIARIRAIDNHAHPLLPVHAGAPPDTDYDALPLAAIPPFPLPTSFLPENPRWALAWHALYGGDSSQHAVAMAQHGDGWPAWALDQMGTDIMLANRVSVGPGLMPPRFRWVAFIDPLLFALDTKIEAQATPDVRSLYPHEKAILGRYLTALHLKAVPPTLDAYLSTVVGPTLDRLKREGAVAIKYEV